MAVYRAVNVITTQREALFSCNAVLMQAWQSRLCLGNYVHRQKLTQVNDQSLLLFKLGPQCILTEHYRSFCVDSAGSVRSCAALLLWQTTCWMPSTQLLQAVVETILSGRTMSTSLVPATVEGHQKKPQ